MYVLEKGLHPHDILLIVQSYDLTWADPGILHGGMLALVYSDPLSPPHQQGFANNNFFLLFVWLKKS